MNMISGNYINFAICEYYNDDVFTTLSQLIFNSIVSCDLAQMRSYEKMNRRVFTLFLQFFAHHLELLFLKFDMPLIEKMLGLLGSGLSDNVFDIQADSTNCINSFNEFVFAKLRVNITQGKKVPQIVTNVQQFYQQGGSNAFSTFLKTILYTLLFEENKNIWMF